MTMFRDWRVSLAFAFALCFWASAFPAIRVAVREYSPTHLALLRFLTASAVLLMLAPVFKVRWPHRRDWPGLAVIAFFGVLVYHTLLNWGEQTVTAGSAAFLIHTSPIFTAVLAGIFLGERLSGRQKLGIGISFSGALLIALGEEGGLVLSRGALLILVSAVSAAIYVVGQKHFLDRYRPFELTAWAFWIGTAMLMVFAPGLLPEMRAASTGATLAIVYMGIFPGALAYVMWAVIIQKTNASTAASLLYAVPLISLVMAWVWIRETPSTLALLGGTVALAGVVVVNWKRTPKVPPEG